MPMPYTTDLPPIEWEPKLPLAAFTQRADGLVVKEITMEEFLAERQKQEKPHVDSL